MSGAELLEAKRRVQRLREENAQLRQQRDEWNGLWQIVRDECELIRDAIAIAEKRPPRQRDGMLGAALAHVEKIIEAMEGLPE